MPSRVDRRMLVVVAILLVLGGGMLLFVEHSRRQTLPPGIASGNGRLEATEVDVAAKFAARLAAVGVAEGDDVEPGQEVASLDARDLAAQLRAAEAQASQARQVVDEARAGVRKAQAQFELAERSLRRSNELVGRGFISGERLDRDRTALDSARAELTQANSRKAEADAAVAAAQARTENLRVTLEDASLKSPITGRVLYRLLLPGEVVAAGGKVLTLLDLSDVFMSIYLPAGEAGKLRLGSAARIVLDALPGEPIPARVVFVAPRAQFTPKEVETRNEREKLMFRVKVQVLPEWLREHADLAKPGMPGLAYVLTEPATPWPAALTPR
ncbi:efflux RND transporter periplasmic adaptor subunit [Accumulibacter sp.]|uniref:HlyD family secretion protein n=1 Tax=Accumulibacter sp. TaxID=2053492 RepID=UPI0025D0C056|nr:efflux RND transporter periplasmic adaptor subunit [Accumulibacter sp.]MCM8627270.1 efflux RND transporter periplasmic adaptor subunit [Accumulibacter sp.]